MQLIYRGGSYLRGDQLEVLSIVQSGVCATGSKLNVQWVEKGIKAKLIIGRSIGSTGAIDRVKGAIQKGNSKGELRRYFGK